ncbi:MarR family winged helix-turn-helix transcriptional regulator [Prevotella sp. KH2C16]|uniref:MarR family winged helix-turn-helix transcriptional regulator n=1 Tax=Prevotella sp. KH2C16 TaxID=1855325 RepID=UPI0008F289DD|nr:MarR family transcriptional regulator [Prevotella sp. KH2C16]SFG17960.1 DNA-binding transcriptional regulator, MarR family [Prevotella sp. KH2C16]
MAYDQLKLDRQLCFRLYTASRLITQAYEPYLRPLGITYTQYLVLLVLWEKDELPINDIGKRLLLGINTISPLIKRMENQGLVARRCGDTDKRQQIVFLTQKGKGLKREAARIPGCMGTDLAGCGLDAETLTGLVPLLDELIAKMTVCDRAVDGQ